MYPVWIGTADNECVSIELNLLKDEVSALTISQCGSTILSSSVFLSKLGISFDKLHCGTMYLLNDSSFIDGELGKNVLYIKTNYDLSLYIKNHETDLINGEYKITTLFKNNKPTYKNKHGCEIVWEDDKFKIHTESEIIEDLPCIINSTIEFRKNNNEKEKLSETTNSILNKTFFSVDGTYNKKLGCKIVFTAGDLTGIFTHDETMWGESCLPYEILIYDEEYCVVSLFCTRKINDYTKQKVYYSYDNNDFVGGLDKTASGYIVKLQKK